MKLIITERQLKILNENSRSKDVWEKDLEGEYIRRYRRNNKTNVKRVQKMLVMLGYDIGHYSDGEPLIDGIYGYRTANAIRQFQEDSFDDRKQWDKIVGPITYTELWNQIDEIANESDSTVDELIIYGLPDVQDTTPSDEEGDHEHEHDHDHDDIFPDEEEDIIPDEEDGNTEEGYVDIDDNRLYTPQSTGNYFGKGKNGPHYGSRGHSGHDYITRKPIEVVWLNDGTVRSAYFQGRPKCSGGGKKNACGGTITIKLNDGRKMIFCHMSEIFVKPGDSLRPGRIIGLTGGASGQKGRGCSTGAHLHTGMKIDGNFVDPHPYVGIDYKFLENTFA